MDRSDSRSYLKSGFALGFYCYNVKKSVVLKAIFDVSEELTTSNFRPLAIEYMYILTYNTFDYAYTKYTPINACIIYFYLNMIAEN